MSHTPVGIEANLYTARANLMSALRLLKECVDELGDGEDREYLADAGKLVDESLMKVKAYGNAGRWSE